MYVVYICACLIFVCIGIYIHAHVHFMRLQRFAAARFCSLHTFAAFRSNFAACLLPYLLSFAPVSIICAVPFSHALPFVCSFCRTFCAQTVTTFIAYGFKTVLGGLFVWRVHLHRLHRFSRLYSLI